VGGSAGESFDLAEAAFASHPRQPTDETAEKLYAESTSSRDE